MSETYQLVSGADPEAALYDGIAFYESGEIYKALTCWKDLLRQVPDHEVAQHYINFVQGYLGIDDEATEREIGSAQRREANQLRGVPHVTSPHVQTSHYAEDSIPVPPESIRKRRGLQQQDPSATALGVIQADSLIILDSAEGLIEEDVIASHSTSHTVARVAQSSVEEMAVSSQIAHQALKGSGGPRTQADGLTVKALSRQLASLHRSGKYEEAVDTAKQLLIQDPQHAVARRYIDEYHRQKQAALQMKRRQGFEGEDPYPSSSAQVVEVNDGSNEPTAVPNAAPAPTLNPAELIPDLTIKPRVKLNPDQISWKEFDHRAGFFTGEVDGQTSYEDLISISAMPREQALKILAQLVASGVIG
jgi:tetratricopeptide (TPR) repeat protein